MKDVSSTIIVSETENPNHNLLCESCGGWSVNEQAE